MLTFGEFGPYRIYCHAPAAPPRVVFMVVPLSALDSLVH
jgi:hypothetical protein